MAARQRQEALTSEDAASLWIIGSKGRVLVDGAVWSLADYANLANASGQNTVAEFQPEPAGGYNVALDGCAAPCATVDGHADGRHTLGVEPAAPDPIVRTTEDPDGVLRILSCHQNNVAVAEISLTDLFQGTGTLDNTIESLGDAIQHPHLTGPDQQSAQFKRADQLSRTGSPLADSTN